MTTALLFPDELRQHVLNMSVDVSEMRQHGEEAETRRLAAIALFSRAATALRMPGSEARADGAERWILWLRLMAPSDSGAAKAEIAASMASGAQAVDLIDLASAFGVPFDDAPLVAYLRLRALSGKLEPAELAAELQLRRRRNDPAQLAAFLKDKRAEMRGVVTPGGYAALLVQASVAAGEFDEAETAWREFQNDLGTASRRSTSRSASSPPSEDMQAASKLATIARLDTGDKPGSIGVEHCRAYAPGFYGISGLSHVRQP